MKDNRMDDLKMNYENIEIPKELRQRVEQGITQAKTDMIVEGRPGSKQKTHRFVKAVVAGVVAAMAALIVVVNVNSSVAYAMKDVPILGTIVEVITFSTYESEDKDMKANVETPQVTVGEESAAKDAADELNKKVKDYTDEIIEQYKKDVEATGGEGYEEVTTDYQVVTDNAQLFSLRINTTVALNTSGVTIKIYHIDKESGKLITLPDLFVEGSDYKKIISDEIIKQMREQMKENGDEVQYFLDDSEISEWNFKGITDDANFYFNEKNNLVFVFDKYEVAPGYMGVCEFEIPSDVTKDILKDCYKSMEK